jgi:hypothetical protein
MSQFTRAERRRVPLRIAITGPTGSGKTYSALRVAFGLGDRVALIDTENGSGSLYADIGRDGIQEYDVLELRPPFSPEQCQRAVEEAVRQKYDVVIIDSLSHFWAGEGGLLDRKDAMDKRGGSSFKNWGEISKQYERLKGFFLQAPLDVIATMRSKMEYVVEEDPSTRKSVPRRIGLAPVMRDGIEYDFTLVFDVAMDHIACASKDRTGLFVDLVAQLTQEHGRLLASWRASGSATQAPPALEPEPAPATQSTPPAKRDRSRSAAPDPSPATQSNGKPPAGQIGSSSARFAALASVHWGQIWEREWTALGNLLLRDQGKKPLTAETWASLHEEGWRRLCEFFAAHEKSCDPAMECRIISALREQDPGAVPMDYGVLPDPPDPFEDEEELFAAEVE